MTWMGTAAFDDTLHRRHRRAKNISLVSAVQRYNPSFPVRCCSTRPSRQITFVTVASSTPLFDTIYSTSRTLFGEATANNLSAALSHASRTLESLFLPSSTHLPGAASTTTGQDTLFDHLNDFLASRSQLENTSILLALCTFLFLLLRNMSWTSRLGNFGRFSPFTRSPTHGPGGAPKVSDSDFSYITADDLRRHQQESVTHQQRSESPTDYGSQRDTDVLILRNKRKEYAVHFPAYSIAKGELTVGTVREGAAKKTGAGDARKIKLLYKGKNLKDDGRTCKQEGLRDGSEVMCTIAESLPSASGSEDEDDDGEEDVEDGNVDGEGVKKRRNRGKKTKRRNRREAASRTSTPDPSQSHLNVPPSQSSTRTASRAASPKPPAGAPATAMDKVLALEEKLTPYLKEVADFIHNPPSDPGKRDFEKKRLDEMIMAQVLLKLDGVDIPEDEKATKEYRKGVVKRAQKATDDLDASVRK